MRAIVQQRYGPPEEVLALRELPDPPLGREDVLVRVHAASVNPADWHLIRGDPTIARLQMGLRRPRLTVPGCDVAGHVEVVGPGVTALGPGDEVFGSPFMRGFGAFAERVAMAEGLLAPKPAGLSFEQAAALPMGALTALQALRDQARVQPGQRVLVIGASGGVGTFAVQLATHLGAEVTAVCSARNADLARSLGATRVVDYTREPLPADGTHDVVVQLAGTARPSELRRALTPKGTLVLSSGEPSGRVLGPVTRILGALVLSPFVGQRLVSFTVEPNRADLRLLQELAEAGRLSPVIDRTYELAGVPDALAYLEQGHARGKVVVTVA